MNNLLAKQVKIKGGFWLSRLRINAEQALLHQWDQLEKFGHIDNFRLVAGEIEGFREGWFFADSDAYKWLDAAARSYAVNSSIRLKTLMDKFIRIIGSAQEPDGYIYTYNQLLFPETRWQNLQIEHELYCHGHLIEAGVSHSQATGKKTLLDIAIKSANLIIQVFKNAGPLETPGHQEIEIALLRLYTHTRDRRYLLQAKSFIEQRGRIKFAFIHGARQLKEVEKRTAERNRIRANYILKHPEYTPPDIPPKNQAVKPDNIQLRFTLNTLSGKYNQQHKPIRKQTIPVGHAVRFTYLQTASAILHRLTPDSDLLPTLVKAWEHMVDKRMYITGGIGSLPIIEGFGRDYELDPRFAYAETCATLGCMFWNWEMTLITQKAQYADLFEWQLYNAAAVGMGVQGRSYLYNNPLSCIGGIERQHWYEVPCCPSNISRTWADLGKYIYSYSKDQLWLHQYITNQTHIPLPSPIEIELSSGLPYNGEINLQIFPTNSTTFTLNLRIPSWAQGFSMELNGRNVSSLSQFPTIRQTASGYSPYTSFYLPITRTWQPGDNIKLKFPMKINTIPTHPRVQSTRHKTALTRGPTVYCLENIDNPNLNIHNLIINTSSLKAQPTFDLLGGTVLLHGQTKDGQNFTAIPYHLWANRGPSQMSVYLETT
jgi:DUF1680 family protein